MTGTTDELQQWDEKWSVGNDLMDKQHKVLISYVHRINVLNEDYTKGVLSDTQEIKKSFDFLAKYTKEHFSNEEALLEKYNYRFLSKHKEIHRHLIEQIEGLQEKFSQHGNAVIPILVKFLNTWWKDHILGIDMKYSGIIGKRDLP